MRVCFMTLGTRGDVQPYLALAKYIISKGHSAIICTSESFKDFIEKEGVEFKKATLDLMALSKSEIGKKILEHPIKNLKLTMSFTKEVVNPQYRKSFDDFYNASIGADIIVYHPKALVAIDIAEKLNIPAVNMPPIPIIHPITEFPSIAVSGSKNFGDFINKMTYMANTQADKGYIKEINNFRQEELSFSKRKSGEYTYFRGKNRIPIVYPISPSLFSYVESFKSDVFLSGFFFMSEEKELPKEALDFTEKGKKPIAVSFSSMPLNNPNQFIETLQKTLKETNNRAVILTGSSGINLKSNDDIFVAESLPHTLLFEKSKGVIHHGGVGTTAAALLSGIPQMVVPFSVDQPFWAKCMFDNKVAHAPIKENELAKETLSLFFKEIDDGKFSEKAKVLSEVIKKEDGLQNAFDYLLNLV